MKLYMHPVSTAARPVRLLIAENGIACDEEMVDILKGAQYQEPYASLNPNGMVPMLEDGALRLPEGSAILKYLADKYALPSYPKDLKKRAILDVSHRWVKKARAHVPARLNDCRNPGRIAARRPRLKEAIMGLKVAPYPPKLFCTLNDEAAVDILRKLGDESFNFRAQFLSFQVVKSHELLLVCRPPSRAVECFAHQVNGQE